MKYPITLKRAKELAKMRLGGRLPRPGYSVVIGGIWTTPVPQYPNSRKWEYQLSLVNSAGRFYLLEWYSPNNWGETNMSQFQEINWPDSRI